MNTVEQGTDTVTTELVNRLQPIVAGAVESVGFELDSIDVQQAGRRKLVKVVVDAEDGVDSDEISSVSRTVSRELDQHEDVLAGAYTLEVTSPGVTRPLTKPRHWRRAKYRQVRITPTDGAEFLARIGQAGERTVRVLVNNTVRDIAYANVAKAVIEVEFRQPPAGELRLLDGESDGGATKGAQEES